MDISVNVSKNEVQFTSQSGNETGTHMEIAIGTVTITGGTLTPGEIKDERCGGFGHWSNSRYGDEHQLDNDCGRHDTCRGNSPKQTNENNKQAKSKQCLL